ncbi:MAG: short-chain dehydrogenase/reductase, partial [Flavobacteriales bacterium]
RFGIEVSIIEPGDFKTSINQNRKLAKHVDQEVYPNFGSALEQVNSEVENAQDPILIAHQIEKIIKCKKPQLYYQVGTPIQKLSIFLKRILPSRVFERMIMKHYKMNTRHNS